MNAGVLKTLTALNKTSEDGSEGNIDEITYQEFDEETALEEGLEEPGLGDVAHHRTYS